MAGQPQPQEVLEQAISKLSMIQQDLERSSAAVLQVAGVGVEFSTIDVEVKRVRCIWQHLEAMLCKAMLDPNDLIVAHKTNQLSYQCI